MDIDNIKNLDGKTGEDARSFPSGWVEPKLEEESGWETKFEERFIPKMPEGEKLLAISLDAWEVKDFIRLTLAQQKEELLQEILGEFPKYPPNSDREELVIKQIKNIIK